MHPVQPLGRLYLLPLGDGPDSGLLALAMWCFCPNTIAYGQLITGDMPATAIGITAFYVFWKWLRQPSLDRALLAGLLLGLAELTKFVWVVLYVLWPVLWIARRVLSRRAPEHPSFLREAGHVTVMVLLSVCVINLGYGFERPFQPLERFHVGKWILEHTERVPGIEGSSAALPVPLPENYVNGIDAIAQIVEAGPASYLQGERRKGGWWYYYPYALLIKLPVGTLVLVALACLLPLFLRGYSSGWRTELFLLIPITALLFFVTYSGAKQYLRYALPILPFAYIWASKTGQAFAKKDWFVAILVVGSLGWSIVSSLQVYPHSLSYFNELIGGPKHGDEHLMESDIDWGQDLLYLKQWLDRHPEARPMRLAYFGCIDPHFAGIEYSLAPKREDTSRGEGQIPLSAQGPQPGWYAVSVCLFRGFQWYIPDGRGGVVWVSRSDYEYFLHFRPAAMAGYSIYIYHIGCAEANEVRRQLGMPLLSCEDAVE
ncbi:MAG: glycosyltransferase family 39 protein [Planctomycetes bacterium]|nr:glycosyltransferase family 39 protein [Planctomycetota bacterium]